MLSTLRPSAADDAESDLNAPPSVWSQRVSPWTRGPRLLAVGALSLAALLAAGAAAALLWSDSEPWQRVLLVVLVLALGALVFAALWRVQRQLRDTVRSVRRFTRRLKRDDLETALGALRSDLSHGASVLGDVADEVEQVLTERERRWRSRARLSADWYWESDTSGRLSWVSDDLSSQRKLGLQPEDLLGRRHDQVPFFIPPEGGWHAFNERTEQRRSFRDVEIEVQRPGRSSVWVALSGRPRRSPSGRFLGYEGVGRDITEHRLAFKRLHDSERRYAVMADLSADWYWETDEAHRLVSFGPVAQELLGELAARAVGSTRWDLHPDGAAPEEWERHRADLDAHRAFRGFEHLVRVPGRGTRWFSISGQPRFDERGRFTGYHGVGRDITLRKRAERVLLLRNAELERLVAQRTAELEQTNHDLEAFARQLAHELRTPIGHVVGLADLLRSRAWERLHEDEREWLTLQAQSARTMSQTVTALLELARSGSVALEFEPVDLSALAAAVIAELPALPREAEVQWRVQPGMQARGSAPLLRVVLMNLLGNAAKFTRDVAAPVVSLSADGEGNYAVEDNGAGFDAERAAALFQPFVRLHSQQQFQGTGLGLSIVRRIVERHGGSIEASALPGGGARFAFCLSPRLPADTAPAGIDTLSGLESPAGRESADDAARHAA